MQNQNNNQLSEYLKIGIDQNTGKSILFSTEFHVAREIEGFKISDTIQKIYPEFIKDTTDFIFPAYNIVKQINPFIK